MNVRPSYSKYGKGAVRGRPVVRPVVVRRRTFIGRRRNPAPFSARWNMVCPTSPKLPT